MADKLKRLISSLYNSTIYSDIILRLSNGEVLHCHRLILESFSTHWRDDDMSRRQRQDFGCLNDISELDMTNIDENVTRTLIRYIYTGELPVKLSNDMLTVLMKEANRLVIQSLSECCENQLIERVDEDCCISFYQLASDINADKLRCCCLEMIEGNWMKWEKEDWSELSAPLLYLLFNEKQFPLHLAIQAERVDVVKLLFEQYTPQQYHLLSINKTNDFGEMTMDMALNTKQYEIVDLLLSIGIDCSAKDRHGKSLIHRAVQRLDHRAIHILLTREFENESSKMMPGMKGQFADVCYVLPSTRCSVLHLLANSPISSLEERENIKKCINEIVSCCRPSTLSRLISFRDCYGNTCLHTSILYNNHVFFDLILNHLSSEVINWKNCDGETALWLALYYMEFQEMPLFFYPQPSISLKSDNSHKNKNNNKNKNESLTLSSSDHYAHCLIAQNVDINCLCDIPMENATQNIEKNFFPEHQQLIDEYSTILLHSQSINDSILQRCIRTKMTNSALYLIRMNCDINYANKIGETALHVAAGIVDRKIIVSLLDNEADPNIQTIASESALNENIDTMSDHISTITSGTNNTNNTNSKKRQSLDQPSSEMVGEGNPFDMGDDNEDEQNCEEYNPFFGGDEYEEEVNNEEMVNEMEDETEENVKYNNPLIDIDLRKISLQTPLHVVLMKKQNELVNEFVESLLNNNSKRKKFDLSLKNSENLSVLSISVFSDTTDIVGLLLTAGANINEVDDRGYTVLHRSIESGCIRSSLFLLSKFSHTTNVLECRTSENDTNESFTPLLLAIHMKELDVIRALAIAGANANAKTKTNGLSALWMALSSSQENAASILVEHSADVTEWRLSGELNMYETLLHRAIQLNDEKSATFLIRAGTNIDVCLKPINNTNDNNNHNGNNNNNNGLIVNDNHQLSSLNSMPLHLACEKGMKNVVEALVEHKAPFNVPNGNGDFPLHLAVTNHHNNIVKLILRYGDVDLLQLNSRGETAYACAVASCNNVAGKELFEKEPRAADQVDSRGYNFLHRAVIDCDLEAVLVLLSAKSNINGKTKDSAEMTPLHFAAMKRHASIVAHLLLVGADVNATAKGSTSLQGGTPLHSLISTYNYAADEIDQLGKIASCSYVEERAMNPFGNVDASSSSSATGTNNSQTPNQSIDALMNIVNVFLDHNVNILAPHPETGDTALHIAAKCSAIDVWIRLFHQHRNPIELLNCMNVRGQTPIHTLCVSCHGEISVKMLDVAIQSCIEANSSMANDQLNKLITQMINKTEWKEGNPPLLLAFKAANGPLCRSLVKYRAQLGAVNFEGLSIFRIPTASHRLLINILSTIQHEPAWTDAEQCRECDQKFSFTLRKHHCRHCGNVLCSKCCDKQIIITKFNMKGAQRVCSICYDVLQTDNE
ncbi:hypothetical protein SNEBB_007851 [Seison nebaliae]|nr:hypothetical protein SNEBB_007851 [Seison nebaliae]